MLKIRYRNKSKFWAEYSKYEWNRLTEFERSQYELDYRLSRLNEFEKACFCGGVIWADNPKQLLTLEEYYLHREGLSYIQMHDEIKKLEEKVNKIFPAYECWIPSDEDFVGPIELK